MTVVIQSRLDISYKGVHDLSNSNLTVSARLMLLQAMMSVEEGIGR